MDADEEQAEALIDLYFYLLACVAQFSCVNVFRPSPPSLLLPPPPFLFSFTSCSFARERSFSPEKTSTLASIVSLVLKRDRADGVTSMEHSFERFTKLIVSHSVNHVPKSTQVFELEDVVAIVDYFTNRYRARVAPIPRFSLLLRLVWGDASPRAGAWRTAGVNP